MKYKVEIPRMVYDIFEVEAETPKDAAYLACRGKVRESEVGVFALGDTAYDDLDTVRVLSDQDDGCGHKKALATFESGDL